MTYPSLTTAGKRKYCNGKGLVRTLVNSARSNAKKEGRAFDIDIEHVTELLSSGRCAVTGIAFVNEHCGPWKASLDRIDGAGGYTKGNVRAVVWIYNRSRWRWTDEDVMIMAKALS